MDDEYFRFVWSVTKGNLELVRTALSSLDDGARACYKRVDEAKRTENEEYASAVVDDACEVVETLLGCAFVLCQAHITKVVTLVHQTTGRGKQEIKRSGSDMVGDVGVSKVEALDALANYFKHRDQWGRDAAGNWARQKKNGNKRTVDVVEKLGLEASSTGNLLKGASVLLGNNAFDDMVPFVTILQAWHKSLEVELRVKAPGGIAEHRSA